jgi:hypothetical protein
MLQLYQSSSYIERFTIYGERHSGTNFLDQCIKQTFGLDLTYFYGFKHWFGFTKPETIRYHPKYPVLFIGIVRNPYQWLQAFYNAPHNIPRENRVSFRHFLNNEWYSVDNNNNEIMQDRNFNTRPNLVRYKNIFELRQQKNKYLLEIMPIIAQNYALISYDSFVRNQQNHLNILQHRFNLRRINDPPEVLPKQKYILPEGEIKDLIDNNIDWSAEEPLGYERDRL